MALHSQHSTPHIEYTTHLGQVCVCVCVCACVCGELYYDYQSHLVPSENLDSPVLGLQSVDECNLTHLVETRHTYMYMYTHTHTHRLTCTCSSFTGNLFVHVYMYSI